MEPFQKAVLHAFGFIPRHGVQRDGMDAAENAVFDVGVVALEAAEQELGLLPLGTAAAIVAHGAVLGEAAGALDEFQVVVPLPGQNVLLADAVHRADEGHAGKAGAVELGRHGLQLGAVEHAHDGRLDDIVEVVAQRDLVAAELLGLAVKVAAPHAGAEVAGRFVRAVGHLEDIGLEYRDGDVQQRRVALDALAVDGVVAWVHDEEHQLKRYVAVAMKLLHELCHQHRVLAAGDADGDLVPCLDQLVPFDGHDKWRPQLFTELFDNAALDFLISFQLTFQNQFSFCNSWW